jgi:hypothetical protein
MAAALGILIGLSSIPACFSPDLGDGAIACGSSGPACPPDYDCVDGRCRRHGTGGSGGGGGADGGNVQDLSVPPDDGGGKPPDLSAGIVDMVPPRDQGGCDKAARVCLDGTHSAGCINGFPVPDRTCPPTSTCADGRCAPLSTAKQCNHTTGICDGGNVCTAFIVGGMLRAACTPPIVGSTGGEQAPCPAAGFDDSCQTGICATTAGGRACAFPCVNVGQCNGATGMPKCENVTAPATIEGASVAAAKVCVP